MGDRISSIIESIKADIRSLMTCGTTAIALAFMFVGLMLVAFLVYQNMQGPDPIFPQLAEPKTPVTQTPGTPTPAPVPAAPKPTPLPSHAGPATVPPVAASPTPVSMTQPAGEQPAPIAAGNLIEARKGFVTKLTTKDKEPGTPPIPPMERIRLIKYPSPAGELNAYITQPPKGTTAGKPTKRPAIIWITGGMSNSLGSVWRTAAKANDQTASIFSTLGIVTMYPSFRGGQGNPGYKESFYGEVDDVLAALKYLKTLDYIDPTRIYLGGHSTGGTLALLVAESTDEFRAVFSFGPVDTDYGPEDRKFDSNNPKELQLRAPINWLGYIRSPTYIIEGDSDPANIAALRSMKLANTNKQVRFYEIPGETHFTLLWPMSMLVASKLVRDTGAKPDISFTKEEIDRHLAMGK